MFTKNHLETSGIVSSIEILNPQDTSAYSEAGLVTLELHKSKIAVSRISYRSPNGVITGYIVEPRDGADLPVVIYCRGGFEAFGQISDKQLFMGQLAQLACQGYTVFASQYSGNDGGEGKDEYGGADIEDTVSLYHIAKAYSRCNSEKIGLYGGSRGGITMYNLLTRPELRIRAIAVESGFANMIRGAESRPRMQEVFVRAFGGSEEEKKKRSAAYWVSEMTDQTPILLLHGTSDIRCSPFDSIDLASELLRQKKPVQLELIAGADHVFSKDRAYIMSKVISWLDRYVKHDTPLPNMEPHDAK
jgi:dipeptidyl aminopeptidase/acylaminoacyl peptidase